MCGEFARDAAMVRWAHIRWTGHERLATLACTKSPGRRTRFDLHDACRLGLLIANHAIAEGQRVDLLCLSSGPVATPNQLGCCNDHWTSLPEMDHFSTSADTDKCRWNAGRISFIEAVAMSSAINMWWLIELEVG